MHQIISSEQYKNTPASKVFIESPELIIRKSLKNNLEKGVIDQPLYESALKQLQSILEKGGDMGKDEVCGTTSSGKPIYKDGGHSQYGNFHEYDHHEAASHHEAIARKEREKKNLHESLGRVVESDGDKDEAKEHFGKMKEAEEKEKHHSAQAQYHKEEAQPNSQKDRMSDIGKKVREIRRK